MWKGGRRKVITDRETNIKGKTQRLEIMMDMRGTENGKR